MKLPESNFNLINTCASELLHLEIDLVPPRGVSEVTLRVTLENPKTMAGVRSESCWTMATKVRAVGMVSEAAARV